MRVVIAKTAGFCMGVRKAMDSVLDAANEEGNNGHVYTEGPLIHNPQVLEMLKEKGINTLGDDTDISKSTVVIRAHGITPERRREHPISSAAGKPSTYSLYQRISSRSASIFNDTSKP